MLPDSCDNLPSHSAKVSIEERCRTSTSHGSRIESLGISSTDQTDLQTPIADSNSRNRNKYADVKGHISSFQPVTAFVSSATDLTHLAGTVTDGDIEGTLQQSDVSLIYTVVYSLFSDAGTRKRPAPLKCLILSTFSSSPLLLTYLSNKQFSFQVITLL